MILQCEFANQESGAPGGVLVRLDWKGVELGVHKLLQLQLAAATPASFAEVPCSFSLAGGGVGEGGHHFVLVTKSAEVSSVRHLDLILV